MDDTAYRAAGLRDILAAIRPHLHDPEAADIASFIDAGELGIAADTIFCAIREDEIAIDAVTAERLAGMTDLFNASGDLDPTIPAAVLRPH